MPTALPGTEPGTAPPSIPPTQPKLGNPPRHGSTVDLPTHERPAQPFPLPDVVPPAPPRVPRACGDASPSHGCSCQRVAQRMQGGVFHMTGSRGGIEIII